MKDINNVTPQVNDIRWRDSITWGNMPKRNEWYHFRLVGGIYSIREHWVEFFNKEGQKKKFCVGCINWNSDTDSLEENGCASCEAGINGKTRYLINAIDRKAQQQMKPGVSPMCGLDFPPMLLREVQSLDKINVHEGNPYPVTHPDFGCDVYLQLNDQSSGNGMAKWIVQKGDKIPLTAEERTYELYAFDEIYKLPDAAKMRADLIRLGKLPGGPASATANIAPVTTVQVPTQIKNTPPAVVTPPATLQNTVVPNTPINVTPPASIPPTAPVVTTPVQTNVPTTPVATQPVVPVATTPIAVTPPTQEITPPVTTTVATHPVTTPIAVTPPSVEVTPVTVQPTTVAPVVEEQPTETVAVKTQADASLTPPDCYPDGKDPSKHYLGEFKCVQCKFKGPCITASGNI